MKCSYWPVGTVPTTVKFGLLAVGGEPGDTWWHQQLALSLAWSETAAHTVISHRRPGLDRTDSLLPHSLPSFCQCSPIPTKLLLVALHRQQTQSTHRSLNFLKDIRSLNSLKNTSAQFSKMHALPLDDIHQN